MKMWLFNFSQANFAGSFKSRATCENTSEPVFEEKHKIAFWTKTKDTKVSKTLSKTYKTLKNIFRFDRQEIEHTHHIWTCTITQMR